ncbi:glycosyl hydrolase family 18 protein [Motilimonas cestriensis]|uniref:glycosyl hydrolase family 18 protein n=1 Tax=Motilimonas cestriensis TaxID=2742685 RepID=UPI003DA1F225
MAIQITYFPMWQTQLNWHKPAHSKLANVPDYISHIILSFVSPQLQFNGDLNAPISDIFFEGEAANISAGETLKQLKACIEQTHGQKVMVSVGGEIGGEFDDAQYDNIALLVASLGLDGIDLDYEPAGLMTATPAQVKRYQDIIIGFRAALDKQTAVTKQSYILSCAPTGVGLLGGHDVYQHLGISEPSLLRFDASHFSLLSENFATVISNLGHLIDTNEQGQELALGELGQASTYRLAGHCHVGTVACAYDFPSTGKMAEVFLAKNADQGSSQRYPLIGHMLDLVIYQAYNMGTANVLARVLCYEAHRSVSEYLASFQQPGFAIAHGCHVGKEAWPQFAYTPKRLGYLYGYIAQFGRPQDGASFWSYSSPCQDDSSFVPEYEDLRERHFSQTSDVFLHTAKALGMMDNVITAEAT